MFQRKCYDEQERVSGVIYLTSENTPDQRFDPLIDSLYLSDTVFFRQDIGEIGKIQKLLKNYLNRLGPDRDYNEIFLIIDEVISNAIISSFRNRRDLCDEFLVARWFIHEQELVFKVFDFGGGLDLNKVLPALPNLDAENYLEQVLSYQDANQVKVPIRGRSVLHSCTGRGLGIIEEFTTDIHLSYFDEDWRTTKTVQDTTP